MNERLTKILEQEETLVFTAFSEDDAFAIGSSVRAAAQQQGHVIACEIRICDRVVFLSGMPGTGPVNLDWLRRKANVVHRLMKSTYRLVLEAGASANDREFPPAFNMPITDFVRAGGGFPIRVKGIGVIGSICVSGAAEHIDHMLIVEAVARHLGISDSSLALPAL